MHCTKMMKCRLLQKHVLGLCLSMRQRSFSLRTLSNKSKIPINDNRTLDEPEVDNIDITLTLEKWDKRLKSAEVGNRDYNLKHLLARALRVEPVNITLILIIIELISIISMLVII